MTRTQKIQKLANAIKDYLGAYHANSGKWIRPPHPTAIGRVCSWLDKLKIERESALAKIHEFHNVGEFNDWIRTL